ncbi:MAG TPA: carboxymuconolactone decarboxylase family protein [Burkholderiales bacterium]|jgi:4-carboxymuconolactone decarboxylase
MDDAKRAEGRAVFREILGEAYQQKRDASTNDFNGPIRRMSEEFAYAGLWNRPGLDRKTRSLITISMLAAINRQHELRVHLEGALNNGCTVEEIREALTHTVAYVGFPAAIDGLRTAEEVLREKGLL